VESNYPAALGSKQWFLRQGTMETVACALTALVYIATLSYGFVYDDVLQILQSPALHSWHYLPQYFSSHVLAAIHPGAAGNYYRPFLLLWLRLNYVVFGTDPAGWHGSTVACHSLATYLVFRVVEKITADRSVAFAAALLFGVHPVHIESVAWISGVSDPLMTCFFLGSLLAFLSWRRSSKVRSAVYSLILFGCALLSKETAVVLPLLIFVLVSAAPQPDEAAWTGVRRIGHTLRTSTPWFVVALLYLIVRSWALHGFSHPVVSLSWKQMLLTWPAVLWFYTRHFFLPIGLSEFYSLSYVDRPTGSGFWLPLVKLGIFSVVCLLGIRALVRTRATNRAIVWFTLALIALPLLPVLDLPSLTMGDIVHDRYLYLPSVGYVLLIALALREIEQLVASRTVWVSLVGAAAIALLFAVLTITQQTQWTNDVELYTRGMKSAPDNLTVRDNLANALLAANHPEQAIPMYIEVLRRNPNFWRSNYNLGLAYYKTGNPTAAEDYLQKAIRIDPSDSDEFIYLAVVELQSKKFAEADQNARQAIARNPRAQGYHFILGLIEEALGDRNAALAALKTEVTEHPDNVAAVAELQKIESPSTLP